MTHKFYVSPHIEPRCPIDGFFPEEVETWLYRNFQLLQNAVFSTAILDEVVDITNTTTETVIYHLDIASNQLHQGESFVISLAGIYSNASASDDFTVYVRLNGTIIHTLNRIGGNQTNAGLDMRFQLTSIVEGVSGEVYDSAIMFDNGATYTSSEFSTHSVDTTQPITIELSFQWVNAKPGNTCQISQGHTQTFHPFAGA